MTDACPEFGDIEQFLLGECEPDSKNLIEQHLSSCLSCPARVDAVRENLRIVQSVQGVLERPPGVTPTQETMPESIGPYRLIRPLGRGGMGVVYEAEQTNPRRRVALKLLNVVHAADEHYRRLFLRESQALARLRHDGIAVIHEAGQAADGRLYFAMELVEGKTLTAYAQATTLSLRGRLELFREICDAIAYAHQRGVIHRDLKPSNILIDAAGRPKVLDFGLAKILETDGQSAPASALTEVGRIQGTLPYMSPEQVQGDSCDADIRTDVYSLGVVLYEFLLGRLPYSAAPTRLTDAARMICEEEPTRPSSIDRATRGEVEAILLKALEKDPRRRYESAAALRDDLGRFLENEPVSARSATRTYQFRKLVARHKVGFSFAAALFAVVTVFAIWMTVLYRQAEELRLVAVASAREADEARVKATTEAKTARRVQSFLTEAFRVADPSQAESTTARQLLDTASEQIASELADEPEIRAAMLESMGTAYVNLGLTARALPLLEKAYDLRRAESGENSIETASVAGHLGAAHWAEGRFPEAIAKLEETLRIHRDQSTPNPIELARSLTSLGGALRNAGRIPEAQTKLEEAASILKAHPDAPSDLRFEHDNELGMLHYSRGDFVAAEQLLRQAITDLGEPVGAKRYSYMVVINNLGLALRKKGDFAAAERFHRESLKLRTEILGPDHPKVVTANNNLGVLLNLEGKREEAEQLLRESLEARRKAVGTEHPHYANSLFTLATVLKDRENFAEAEPLAREALALRKRLQGATHPLVCDGLVLLGEILSRKGDFEGAEATLREALEILQEAAAPDVGLIASALKILGTVCEDRDGWTDPDALLELCLGILRHDPGGAGSKITTALVSLALVEAEHGYSTQARILLGEVVQALQKQLGESDPRTQGAKTALDAITAQTTARSTE